MINTIIFLILMLSGRAMTLTFIGNVGENIIGATMFFIASTMHLLIFILTCTKKMREHFLQQYNLI